LIVQKRHTIKDGKSRIIVFLVFSLFHFFYINGYAQDEIIDTTKWLTVPGEEESRPDYFLPVASDTLRIDRRHLPDSDMAKYLADEAFWYANADPEEKKTVSGVGSKLFRDVLWVIIMAGFAGIIVWYLVYSNVGFFARRDSAIDTGENAPEETDDIFSINYPLQIEKAGAAGNFRLAIRFLFLRLLRDLAQKNVIQYRQGKTNFEYLVQLHPTVYYKDFFRLVRHYEYAWYGKFEINSDTYNLVKKDFDGFSSNYLRQ